MKTNRKESLVKSAVDAYLATRADFWGWRANSGGANFDGFHVKFNKAGVSDFLGLQAMKVTDTLFVGRFTGIETKRERGGKQSEAQIEFQQNIEAHGGLYILARDVETVHAAMGPVLVHVKKIRRVRVVPR